MNAIARALPSFAFVVLVACDRSPAAPAGTAPTPVTSASPASAVVPASAPPPALAGSAHVGAAAPDFTLPDLDGKAVSLHDYKGKTVVLEWFNPSCPFVKAAHTKGSLKGTAARREAQGIVWLAINSAAEGREGFGADKSRAGKERYGLDHPILMDPAGAVGHAYGATNTPHMFVIDPAGTLVYAGAIDNSPDGEGESPQGGKLVSYVDEALDALAAKRPITVSETKAYGCSVKYGH